MTNEEIIRILLMISPIILIQVGLATYGLVDIARRKVVRGPRWAWAVGLMVTAFGIPLGLIVSGLYLAWGRHGETEDDSN